MKRGPQGVQAQRGGPAERFSAFVPHPLPPEPPLAISAELADLAERANRALGRLDALATLLPDAALFLYVYVRKEALVSSQIEGTQSSLSDLILFEDDRVPGLPNADVEEVSRYVEAMQYGLRRIEEGFPLSLRLLREIHGILLSTGRGSEKAPGAFRTSQNWIGGTRPGNARFVPPPPDEVLRCLGDLERFLHDQPVRTPVLIKAALAHVQFETIHPFLDGNGRLGRLLITFLLCAEGALSAPLLYLSLYFKEHRERYYELLQEVRELGNWEDWVEFFLEGVLTTAEEATDTARRVLAVFDEDRLRLEQTGRAAGSYLRIMGALQKRPAATVARLADEAGISQQAATRLVANLVKMGLLREITGKHRDRVYVYDRYWALLAPGTDPFPAIHI